MSELLRYTKRDADQINWSQYCTAYGDAEEVPNLLVKLASADEEIAKGAAHDLWCGLCHQHAYISSAALPSYPIMFDILQVSDERLTVEILDIMLGLARCSAPKIEPQGNLDWVIALRKKMINDRSFYFSLINSENVDIREFSASIIEELDAS